MLYPKLCYNEHCYKEVCVWSVKVHWTLAITSPIAETIVIVDRVQILFLVCDELIHLLSFYIET